MSDEELESGAEATPTEPEESVEVEPAAVVEVIELVELDENDEVIDVIEVIEIAEPKPVPLTDEVLLASVDVARAALLEITTAAAIGDVVGSIAEEDHVLSLLFDSKLPGYPGWRWTVTLSRIDEDSAPSVLEVEMLPGEDALIAPDWVPWSERLAEYQLAQELAAATGGDDEDQDEGFDDEDSDEDFGDEHSDEDFGDDESDDDDVTDGDLDDDDDDDLDLDDHVTDDDELTGAEPSDEEDEDPHAEGRWDDR